MGPHINFGSASVFEGVVGQAHYVAAKAGIIGLTRCLAREFGDFGITVDTIAPGLTITPPVLKNFPEAMLKQVREGRALKRDETPEDLVGTTFFLASPDADFVTECRLTIEGRGDQTNKYIILENLCFNRNQPLIRNL